MNSQFKKGVLEIIVLSLMSNKDEYGYSLFRYINNKINIAEGTLYPLLRKMVKENLLSVYYQESKEGPARKYYRLTYDGKKKLQSLIIEWSEFSDGVDYFIQRGKTYE
ncbi:PadR family transcriptional regulator (plasmid) [Staphylococcus simulans]|uniref:PadR family transcriptional regulator n=1 Tax=Staphylococcus simulans TaxID=1286 RepID=UPI000D09E931|nr:PadR family transcriptional regulator [Staphylococcus simulans]AVO03436.1 PadR family transcriptional regulator [Staphylococcus simulans]AVO06301.1 PadR family transcriptional regulator [Staphylococcus simulans]AWG19985.1 PadR family transcriptional regulator [Staphylococcus simulans]AWI02869.1 PadR family transcriptional regulator [Staphylococcus simulans]